MTRDEALAKLRPMEAGLRARGIAALYLFGSVARGEATAKSDVDLAFELTDIGKFSLIDQYQLEEDIADIVGRPVDLVEQKAIRPRVLRHIERDLLRVF